MSRFIFHLVSKRISLRLAALLNPHPFRVALACAGSIVVLAASLSSAQSNPPRAGNHPPAGTTHSPSLFVTESRATLKGLHETMARLAAQVLADVGSDVPAEGGEASQSLVVESAKAGHQQAVLNREAAQIALKEYQENIFKRDKESYETEIKLAQAELESAKRTIPQASERLARFNQVRTGSAGDLSRRWRFESGEIVAQLQAKKAQFTLEQAQSKLTLLMGLEKWKHEKGLMADVEKARSDELAKQVSWGLEQSKLVKIKQIQEPANGRFLLTDQRRLTLALLDRAIPIEERLSVLLDQIKEDRDPGDAIRTDITDLTRRLQGIVAEAQHGETAAALSRLKSRLGRSSSR